MCGICGYISKNKMDDKVLEAMRDTMVHRGPNDAGIWQTETKRQVNCQLHIGLAHRRLSIFDLSELGHQPMLSSDQRYTIVFNGEIYNFKEIRGQLQQRGYTFKSECDTEVILYAFDNWQEQCFERFNGMFAIAIWDSMEEKLILARDRMGVKPLYYYWNRKNQNLVFASELKPIMKSPEFLKNIDRRMLGNYLCNKYIQAPYTIFEDTYKLIPGTYAIYQNGDLTICKYWDVLKEKAKGSRKLISDYDEAKRTLDKALTDAVMTRMVADVPVGMFLSSGIDSALVTAIAQKNSNNPVRTFTIGFDDRERNEADRAERIARYLGTEHTELYIGEKEIFELLEDITEYYDEPFADSSQLPTMLVSKLAAGNVTVALSGDGGDELFCGYKMYDLERIAQMADPIGGFLYHIPGMKYLTGKQNDGPAHRTTPGMNGTKKAFTPEIRAFINNRDKAYKTQLFADVFREEAQKLLPDVDFNPKFEFESELQDLCLKSYQERRMLLDMTTYLPDEVMAKTDRASMKYSLEVRSPILDVNVVETSFRIPHEFKCYTGFRGNLQGGPKQNNIVLGDKKHILKDLAYDYVPKELLSGPKKGFGVPLRKWLMGPLKGEIERYSDKEFIRKQGVFSPEGVAELIRKQEISNNVLYSSMLWSYYMFQRWWEQYVME